MIAYLLSRIGQTLLTLAVMSVLVFVGVYMVGNPVDMLLSATATPAERLAAAEQLRQIAYGYDAVAARIPDIVEFTELKRL